MSSFIVFDNRSKLKYSIALCIPYYDVNDLNKNTKEQQQKSGPLYNNSRILKLLLVGACGPVDEIKDHLGSHYDLADAAI